MSTVCEVLQKLRQVKEVKKEELLARDDEIKELRTKVDEYEQENRFLKAVADTDSETLQQTANLLTETQTSLRNTEDRIRSYQGEVRRLKHRVTVRESDYSAISKELWDLKMKLFTLRVAQRTEFIEVKAKNEEAKIGFAQPMKGWIRS